MKNVKILFLGPAGAGKGTQSTKLAEKFDIAHISTGDVIRAEIKSGSELGNKVKAIVESGSLVSDDIVNEIVKSGVTGKDSFILDGYPRTLEQAKFFDENVTKFDYIFDLQVDKEQLVTRLEGRRVCTKEKDPKCKGTFHIEFDAPKTEGICDLCGSAIMQRKDDTRDAIENRLNTYASETGKPLEDFYSNTQNYIKIDASKKPDEVFAELLSHLEKAAV